MADSILDQPLDPKFLNEFCHTWIGSGDTNPKVVFVGMEFSVEAQCIQTLNAFFQTWDQLDTNSKKLIANYRKFVDTHMSWAKEYYNVGLQSKIMTRNRMVKIAYCILNNVNYDSIGNTLEYRKFKMLFASSGSKTAALEIWPLPCRFESHWPYSKPEIVKDILGFDQFGSKNSYKNFYRDKRKELIQRCICNSSTELVISYSHGLKDEFEDIFGVSFSNEITVSGRKFSIAQKGNRLYALLNHLGDFIPTSYLQRFIQELKSESYKR
jgi:hypothetical protein